MPTEVSFEQVAGSNADHDLTVYALSTCGFCKRALKFLRDNSLEFKYVYVDKLPYDTKQALKAELKDKYNHRVYFPFLVIDDEDILVGFTEKDWRAKLNV